MFVPFLFFTVSCLRLCYDNSRLPPFMLSSSRLMFSLNHNPQHCNPFLRTYIVILFVLDPRMHPLYPPFCAVRRQKTTRLHNTSLVSVCCHVMSLALFIVHRDSLSPCCSSCMVTALLVAVSPPYEIKSPLRCRCLRCVCHSKINSKSLLYRLIRKCMCSVEVVHTLFRLSRLVGANTHACVVSLPPVMGA